MKYRLREGFKHYVGGKRLAAGDEVELSESSAKALADRFEPVSATKSSAKTSKAKTGTLGLEDALLADAVDKVSKLDSPEALDAAAKEEKAGKDRKGVHEAIDARRAELAEK